MLNFLKKSQSTKSEKVPIPKSEKEVPKKVKKGGTNEELDMGAVYNITSRFDMAQMPNMKDIDEHEKNMPDVTTRPRNGTQFQRIQALHAPKDRMNLLAKPVNKLDFETRTQMTTSYDESDDHNMSTGRNSFLSPRGSFLLRSKSTPANKISLNEEPNITPTTTNKILQEQTLNRATSVPVKRFIEDLGVNALNRNQGNRAAVNMKNIHIRSLEANALYAKARSNTVTSNNLEVTVNNNEEQVVSTRSPVNAHLMAQGMNPGPKLMNPASPDSNNSNNDIMTSKDKDITGKSKRKVMINVDDKNMGEDSSKTKLTSSSSSDRANKNINNNGNRRNMNANQAEDDTEYYSPRVSRDVSRTSPRPGDESITSQSQSLSRSTSRKNRKGSGHGDKDADADADLPSYPRTNRNSYMSTSSRHSEEEEQSYYSTRSSPRGNDRSRHSSRSKASKSRGGSRGNSRRSYDDEEDDDEDDEYSDDSYDSEDYSDDDSRDSRDRRKHHHSSSSSRHNSRHRSRHRHRRREDESGPRTIRHISDLFHNMSTVQVISKPPEEKFAPRKLKKSTSQRVNVVSPRSKDTAAATPTTKA